MVPSFHIKQLENLKDMFIVEITYEDRVSICLKTLFQQLLKLISHKNHQNHQWMCYGF